ncbi:DUF6701 domain-containing protein [Ferrimonas sp. SCSIO 43195]|uniref:DUF6701 domain-containing protein n=1 Tax=Ferrimonas sp. SCSIO 43195 TaxID=2822844 RepID=UPI0020757251|nr:DUF6701 domain-containing protein [Ferrimonas sp. SCSIO 43195]USD37269.1 hypothetical protein J8Z22_20170 [Ferrimonas sp. SCSIO 43195]
MLSTRRTWLYRIIAFVSAAAFTGITWALPMCVEVFPSALQGHKSGAKVTLKDQSRVYQDPDNTFEFVSRSFSSNYHCGGGACAINNQLAERLSLPSVTDPNDFANDPNDFPSTSGGSSPDLRCNGGRLKLGQGRNNTNRFNTLVVPSGCMVEFHSKYDDYYFNKLVVEAGAEVRMDGQRLFVRTLEMDNWNSNYGIYSVSGVNELHAYNAKLEGGSAIYPWGGTLEMYGYHDIKVEDQSSIDADFAGRYMNKLEVKNSGSVTMDSNPFTIKTLNLKDNGVLDFASPGTLRVKDSRIEDSAIIRSNAGLVDYTVYHDFKVTEQAALAIEFQPHYANSMTFYDNDNATYRFAPGDYPIKTLDFGDEDDAGSSTRIAISGAGTVRWFLKDSGLNLRRGIRINDGGSASSWQVYTPKDSTLRDQAQYTGVLYSADKKTKIEDQARILGVVSADDVELKDQSAVYYRGSALDGDFSGLCVDGSPDDDPYIRFGRVTLNGSGQATISFDNYSGSEAPLVFLMPPTDKATVYQQYPASVRVRSVSVSGATIERWRPHAYYGSPSRLDITEVDYLVVSPGRYSLKDSAGIERVKLEAGLKSSCKYAGKSSSSGSACSAGSESITFGRSLSGSVAVLAELQSHNNINYWAPFFTARVESVTSSGFRLGLEGSEVDNYFWQTENIGWLAIDGSGTVDINGELLKVESGNHLQSYRFSGNNYRSTRDLNQQCWNSNNFSFASAFPGPPLFFSNKRTRHGGDGGWARTCTLTATQFNVIVEEDYFSDGERSHYGEYFSYLAIEAPSVAPPTTVRLRHPDTAINCVGAQMVVDLCSNANCTSFDTSAELVVTFTSTVAGQWKNNRTGQTGSTLTVRHGDTLTLWQPLETTVTLGVSNHPYQCLSDNGDADCQVDYKLSGLLLTPDTAEMTSCKTGHRLQVAVVETDSNSPQQCIAGASGSETVNLSFAYEQPSSPEVQAPLYLDGLTFTASAQQSLTMDFSIDGTDSVSMRYPEAGKLKLLASMTRGEGDGEVTLTGEASFDWLPAGFHIGADNEQCDSNFTRCKPYRKAGQSLDVDVSAHCWVANDDGSYANNPVTKNFRHDGIKLKPELVAPANANASNSTDDANAVAEVTAGGSGSADKTLDEVGVFRYVLDGDVSYLGGKIDEDNYSSRNIGRITPAYLSVQTDNTQLEGYCGDFSYLGQPIAFSHAPVLTVVAKGTGNKVTNNFDSEFWNLGNPLDSLSYATGVAGLGLQDTGLPALERDSGDFDGSREFALSKEWLRFRRPVAAMAPVNYHVATGPNLQMSIDKAAFTINADQVCLGQWGSCEGTSFGTDVAGVRQSYVLAPQLRYGRAVLASAYGSENQTLTLPLTVEYYNGANFSANILDGGFYADGRPYVAASPGSSGRVSLSGSLNPMPLTSGNGYVNQGEFPSLRVAGTGAVTPTPLTLEYHLEAPFVAQSQCSFPNQDSEAPTWLQWYWESATTPSNPKASVTLGRFRGHDKVIYRREIF